MINEFEARVITAWLGDETSNLALANPGDDELSLMAQCMLLDRINISSGGLKLKPICLCMHVEAQPGRSHVVEQTPRYVNDSSAIQMQYRAESRAALYG